MNIEWVIVIGDELEMMSVAGPFPSRMDAEAWALAEVGSGCCWVPKPLHQDTDLFECGEEKCSGIGWI